MVLIGLKEIDTHLMETAPSMFLSSFEKGSTIEVNPFSALPYVQ